MITKRLVLAVLRRLHLLHITLKVKHGIEAVYYKNFYFRFVQPQWQYSQKEYLKWTKRQLPEPYIKIVQRLGILYRDFIGEHGFCLDIGCGNGEISNTDYEGIGYTYFVDQVMGIDPLRCVKLPPWINVYVQAVSESMPFRNCVFDSLTFATSLDHVKDIESCLQECNRVLKPHGKVNIWTTCDPNPAGDFCHATRIVNVQMLENLLLSAGFKIAAKFVERIDFSGDTVFMKGEKSMSKERGSL